MIQPIYCEARKCLNELTPPAEAAVAVGSVCIWPRVDGRAWKSYY
jgi:hypothetical protein